MGPAQIVVLAQLVVLVAAGCSARVEVLSADGAGRTGPAADGGAVALGCGVCEALELCAIDHCVDATGTTALGAGLRHSCAVAFGALLCWGDDGSAQLGVAGSEDRLSPVRVDMLDDWLAVAAGSKHTCAIRSPGALYCWGENSAGQLGVGDADPRPRPTRVPGHEDFSQVVSGGDGGCALRADGTLYCWGDPLRGVRDLSGRPEPTFALEPEIVMGEHRFIDVSVGAEHRCAVRNTGELYCWGRNTDGQLGAGTREQARREPSRVGADGDWRSVSAGEHHTCGVRGEGELYCWGRNDYFELGIGPGSLDDATQYALPVRVGADSDWSTVATGGFHTCAIKRSGALFCFGRGAEGQLGLGASGRGEPIAIPRLVAPTQRFRRVTLGSFHTCALDEQRNLSCWGGNTDGQLGVGDTASRDDPTPVQP